MANNNAVKQDAWQPPVIDCQRKDRLFSYRFVFLFCCKFLSRCQETEEEVDRKNKFALLAVRLEEGHHLVGRSSWPISWRLATSKHGGAIIEIALRSTRRQSFKWKLLFGWDKKPTSNRRTDSGSWKLDGLHRERFRKIENEWNWSSGLEKKLSS